MHYLFPEHYITRQSKIKVGYSLLSHYYRLFDYLTICQFIYFIMFRSFFCIIFYFLTIDMFSISRLYEDSLFHEFNPSCVTTQMFLVKLLHGYLSSKLRYKLKTCIMHKHIIQCSWCRWFFGWSCTSCSGKPVSAERSSIRNALVWKLISNRQLFTHWHPCIKISIYPYLGKNTSPGMSRQIETFHNQF